MKRTSLITLLALGLLLGTASIDSAAKAEIVCEEGILVWSWAHMDWICSLSNGGGAVCTLCHDSTDVIPDQKN